VFNTLTSLGPYKKPVLVIHGGAGPLKRLSEDRLKEIARALEYSLDCGFKSLLTGSAVDGVVEAVKCMEDSGVFNAGKGSVLNIKGCIEMDAGLMDGKSLRAGAVAQVGSVKNPIILARFILEKTDHVLVVGKPAEELARVFGLELASEEYFNVKDKMKRLRKAYEKWVKGESYKFLTRLKDIIEKLNIKIYGTVGAVALDNDGYIAAACSTGGYWLKLPGRVGDSPIPGAGFYANRYGGASATGVGEYIMLASLSKYAVDLISQGVTASTAAQAAIDYITTLYGKDNAGIITVDQKGYVGFAYNTEGMSRAIKAKDIEKPIITPL